MSGTDKRPTVISLFAGCGGSSLGYRQAGYRCLAAVEWDAHAVTTYRANFPGTPVLQADITKLTGADILTAAGIRAGKLDVLDGSPPCQSFSTAGKRRMDDPRSTLFGDYARILTEIRPRVFVAENVSGLMKGKMRGTFKMIFRMLETAGYRVACRLMDAQYMGVPQTRQRLIFIGVRDDLDIAPSHPKPDTLPMAASTALGITVAAGQFQAGGYAHNTSLSQPAATITRIHPPILRRTNVLTDDYRGAKRRPVLSAPAPALRAHVTLSLKDGEADGTRNETREAGLSRRVTIDEAKALQGFPQDFKIEGTYTQCWARIGNSVPPPMMERIARHIREHLLD